MTNAENNTSSEIKVSIIMSLYNVELYMRVAIESVLRQTLKEFELICVNDGSSDYSLQTAQEYAEKDELINLLMEQTERSSVADLLNASYKQYGVERPSVSNSKDEEILR